MEQEKKWYVLRAISGKEKKIKEYIEAEIIRSGISDYVSQVVIPTEKVFSIRNGKKVVQEKNYFPGYIFVEAILVGEVPHLIKNIPGVIGYPGVNGEPVALDEDDINRILGKANELSSSEEIMDKPYLVGESVKIIDGAFNGFTGEIEDVNEAIRELKVMVKIFGRKTPIDLKYTQVEREA